MSYLDLADRDTVFLALAAIDRELALTARRAGCPKCGGPLHRGTFERKPRGATQDLPEEMRIRLGLCCGWCRGRVLPLSCLFFGRRVFLGVAVLLVTAAVQGIHPASTNELCRRFEVSRRTVKRWVRFFEAAFPRSNQWSKLRGRMPVCIADDDLPRGLLLYFFEAAPTAEEGLVTCTIVLGKAGPPEHGQ